MEMNMTNRLWNWGYLMQKKQLKITGWGIQVETYKERGVKF